jgi:Carboxypeptidase regulatory-like domain
MALKWSRFLERLPKVQMIVGLMAGIVSILGALYSVRSPSRPTPLLGELVAVVRDNRSNKPVTDAMVEVLTPTDAVVTRLTTRPEGRARIPLREGDYRLLVSHPHLGRDIRQIHVRAGQTAVFQIVLGLARPRS